MRVVIDANIAIAALLRPEGWTGRQLARREIEWIAPASLFDELASHAEELSLRARCARLEWRARVRSLRRRIRTLPDATLVRADRHPWVARVRRLDPDDVPYVAAVLASRADLLWTRDRVLLEALPGIAVNRFRGGKT